MPEQAGKGPVRIVDFAGEKEYLEDIRLLFMEYADSPDFDLAFQDFQEELASLPGKYAFPGGAILIALAEDSPAGCVAMRPLPDHIAEMKRLYVRPSFRGLHLGRKLVSEIIERARSAGYRSMRLDSVDTMVSAMAIYRSFGFREISPYCYNPVPGVHYFELELGRSFEE